MTSRERVRIALSHRVPDRVPIDFGGHRSSGISAMAYARLRRHLGLAERPIRVYDLIQQLAVIDDDVLDLFGVDTIELGRAFAREAEHWKEWTLPDGTPCQIPVWTNPVWADGRWQLPAKDGRSMGEMMPGTIYFEQSYHPFSDEDDLDHLSEAMETAMWTSVKTPPGPLAGGPEGREQLRAGAQRLRSETDRAVLGLFGGNLLEMGQVLYGLERFFLLLAGEPERAHAFLDRLTALHLANLERFLAAVGDQIDIVLFGDDLGSQRGPLISPAMYREFFKSRHGAMWRRAHELSEAKVMLHCCGGVRELLPDLIDAGLDAINPVQISCRGMEPAGLKRDFGDRLVFWGGGCDTQLVLRQGTPAETREHVRRMLDLWSPGGGYVFQQVHNVLADVPPANLVAMLEAVREA
ncbi:MAG: methyltransferase [Verrucomicrobia bacterium]|nr:methyltransferase [Verrucomicrobiota bacterium]